MHVLGLGVVIELEADLITVEGDRPVDVADGQDHDFQGPVHERASQFVGGYTLFNAGEASISSVWSSSIETSMNGEKATIASTSWLRQALATIHSAS